VTKGNAGIRHQEHLLGDGPLRQRRLGNIRNLRDAAAARTSFEVAPSTDFGGSALPHATIERPVPVHSTLANLLFDIHGLFVAHFADFPLGTAQGRMPLTRLYLDG
jgi:hypothetical protein